ncbi:MAG TPA: hypothetical protein PLX25_03340 [Sphaerochaeta sp.]|nr:hypothetical protein [Sphaerochaeta sp.]HPZ15677.1 hypothetical protein [Sphaerochaeta sp.]
MRKVVLTLAIITLILVPVAATNSFALGLNLGTNTGLGVQYQMNDFDVVGNVGYGLLNGFISVDAAASYKVADFSINKARFDVTAGVGGYVGIPLDSDSKLSLAVIVPVGLKYSLANKDWPLDFYLRFSPGVQVLDEVKFFWGANVAALWRFN